MMEATWTKARKLGAELYAAVRAFLDDTRP
jgi:hypothetical protein